MNQPVNSPEVVTTADSVSSETLIPAVRHLSSQTAVDLIHEIRSPLTSINLSIEMLELSIKENDLKMLLDIIKRNSARVNDLVTEIIKHQQASEVSPESIQ
jgi:signal transduction histidine kinase